MNPIERFRESLRGWWIGPINSSDKELAQWYGNGAATSSTGLNITEESSLTYSAFWACVNAISTDVASVPLINYKRLKEGGKERNTGSKLYRLLHDEPNPQMSAISFRQVVTAHGLTWGNGFAEIQRGGDGQASALWPITPNRVTVRLSYNNAIEYAVARQNGGEDIVPAEDMLHIPGLGYNGLIGYSVVTKARESIGLGLATERFGGTFFGNGSTFGGVLSHPMNLTPEVKKGIRESLNEIHQGPDRAHKFVILGGGMKYDRLGIPPDDAQFLETRQFQLEEMCRWFRMPPHKIQSLLRSTNNNIEHQGIEYYTDTMRPWCVRWEQECNRKLIAPMERRQQFVEHNVDAILRGDITSRYAAYAVGRQWGWLSADDVRDRENLNPLPNGAGKIYLVPMNMSPADKLAELTDAQIEAKKAPPQPQPSAEDPAKTDAQAKQDAANRELLEGIQAAIVKAEERSTELAAKIGELDAPESTELADVRAELGTLKALHLEVTEKLTREQAEREAERVASTSVEAKLATERDERANHWTELAGAHRAIVLDAMQRIVRKETDRARRNQATPAKLRAWADSFYLTRLEECVEALRPALRVHLAAIGSTADVDAFARDLLSQDIMDARAQIRAVADGDQQDFGVTLERVLSRWEQVRPDAIADHILQQEISYVRSL